MPEKDRPQTLNRGEQGLAAAIFSEALATALLLAGVVGSGIMAETLSQGNTGLALLANAVATGALLPVLIMIFGPVSGAHMNPAVSLTLAAKGWISKRRALAYGAAQTLGALAGVALAHAMFAMPLVQASDHVRAGWAQVGSETVATFGLLLLILRVAPRDPEKLPMLVGLYITAAYWFTASTSFANPAVTLARSFTCTFAGIRLSDAPGFWLGQIAGALLALGAARLLGPALPPTPSISESNKNQ